VIPKKLRKHEPSYVSRYWLTGQILHKIGLRSGEKVLDGGGHGSLLPYFVNSDVHILDLPKSKEKNYIQASALDMPLNDNSFPFVVSCDVLEHIPSGERSTFLMELIRVAEDSVILSAPFSTPEVTEAELSANNFYKDVTGHEHRWLEEHIAYGLPTEQETAEQLKKMGVHFQIIRHNSIVAWEIILKYHLLSATKGSDDISNVLTDLYEYYYDFCMQNDFGKHSYRTTFVISKRSKHKRLEWSNVSDTVESQLDTRSRIISKIIELDGDRFFQINQKYLKMIQEYKERNMESMREIAALKKNLSRVHSSISWRITSPLRLLRAFLGKVK
jgi:cyclopropane fatty-acyl-phospholipid synthase-like methyltransferase